MTHGTRARNRVGRMRGALVAVLGLAWCGATLAADRIRIEIEGVDRAIAANVRTYLTLGRYVQRDDLTDPQVRRLADRAVDEATDALRPYGYYAPSVRSRTTRDDENWIVRLFIVPGEPVRFHVVDIAITGQGEDDTTLRSVIHNSTVKPGARLEHTAYERLKLELLRSAQERGYVDAKLERHELIVDPEAQTADVHVALTTGGRYQFGEIQIEQSAISDRLFAGYLRFAEGQPYSPERVRSTQFALEDSNYFSTVTVIPGDPDPKTLTVPVTVRGEPIKRDRYSVSAGYGTDTGVRGKFTWDNRRVNKRGHRWQVQLTASSVLTEAIARYIIPVGDPSLEKLEFSTGYINEEIGDLESERCRGHRQRHRGDGELATCAVSEAQRGAVDLRRRDRPDGSALDTWCELFQPAAELPHGLGPRCGLLLRADRQPADARLGCLLPAFRRPRGKGLAHLRPVVPASARRGRCELDQ